MLWMPRSIAPPSFATLSFPALAHWQNRATITCHHHLPRGHSAQGLHAGPPHDRAVVLELCYEAGDVVTSPDLLAVTDGTHQNMLEPLFEDSISRTLAVGRAQATSRAVVRPQ
jgi:hypothetical protein